MTQTLAVTLGLQRALKRANVLTHDETLPVNEAQIAARAMLAPAVQMSAQAAEEIVSGWLKMNCEQAPERTAPRPAKSIS